MPMYGQRGLLHWDRLGRETGAPEVLATCLFSSLRQIQPRVLLTGHTMLQRSAPVVQGYQCGQSLSSSARSSQLTELDSLVTLWLGLFSIRPFSQDLPSTIHFVSHPQKSRMHKPSSPKQSLVLDPPNWPTATAPRVRRDPERCPAQFLSKNTGVALSREEIFI